MADSISASTTVVGVKDALRILNNIDKQARRDLTKDFKQITAPVTNDIKAKLPRSAPLSGMARKWTTASGFQMFPYNDKQNKVASGVQIKHTESGAIGRASDTRSQEQNRKLAFERLTKTPKFKFWFDKKMYEINRHETLEQTVEKEVCNENCKFEIKEDGKWKEVSSSY